jgi:acyl-CoA thioester hydrolase
MTTGSLSPYETYKGVVAGVDCDLMGHMNTARYAAVFDAATWAMLRVLGYSWKPDNIGGWADAKNVTEYFGELAVDASYNVVTSVSRVGTKSVTFVHELRRIDDTGVAARCEVVLVSFDRLARKSSPLPDEFRSRAEAHVEHAISPGG